MDGSTQRLPTPTTSPAQCIPAGRRARIVLLPALLSTVAMWPVALSMLPSASQAAEAGLLAKQPNRLNDTGKNLCVDYQHWKWTRHCAGSGQDGEFGRDASAPRGTDGRVGFSFVKLDADGLPLPPDAAAWNCVQDKVTGVIWENKTHDGGLHDAQAVYTNIGDGRSGDASRFVAKVNAAGWCGAQDWRLPTRREMESLLDFSRPDGGPMIDSDWFPDTATNLHWTSTDSTVNGGGPGYRWAVSYYAGNSIWYYGEYGDFAVRLVRQGHKVSAKRWQTQGAEVLDSSTRLVWRRCTEGQSWNGSTCTGTASVFLTVRDAVDHAKAVAESTGVAWRAPNIKELSSVVDARVNMPAVDRLAFPGFGGGSLHTATSWTDNPVYSWRVEFGRGGINLDFWGGSLLLVRDAD